MLYPTGLRDEWKQSCYINCVLLAGKSVSILVMWHFWVSSRGTIPVEPPYEKVGICVLENMDETPKGY